MVVQPKSSVTAGLALVGSLTLGGPAYAAVITDADIPGGASSFTTGDGLVTLTPTVGGAPATIGGGGSGCCFGVGNDQINDADGDPSTTGDQEALGIDFDASVGLTSISFIFTRATTEILNGNVVGPAEDGIRISGFLADPGVSYFSEDNPGGTLNNISEVESVTYDALSGTLNIDHAWRGGAVTVFEFSNLAASLGQTLSITVADQDEANPQANVRAITYAPVPEPASLTAAALVATMIGRRRRRTALAHG